jgi:hypothetical protein
MVELYIYYRVDNRLESQARVTVLEHQARLRRSLPGLTARLLRKQPDHDDEDPTWMEIYAQPEGLSPALRAGLDALSLALAPVLRGPRHHEVFEPCV